MYNPKQQVVKLCTAIRNAYPTVFECFDNASWFMTGAHIGQFLLFGQQWYGQVIVIYTATSVIKGVGIELIFSKDPERIAKGVLYAALISSWLVIALNLVGAVV